MALKMRSTGGMDSPEAGTYMARIVGLVDLDLQPGYMYKDELVEPSYKISVTYELPGSRTKDDKPHFVTEEFKFSDHENSTMFARVSTLDPNGTITDRGNNLANLIDTPCMVSISITKTGWPKVTSVSGAPAGIPVPELENTPYTFDFDTPSLEVYKRLPEFVRKKLKESLNYEGSPLHALVTEHGLDDDKF